MTKPCRHSIRLKQYDYSADGMYFLTICSYKQKCVFGNISQDGYNVNDIGLMIIDEFLKLPQRFPIVNCGDYIMMPNHFHCIVEINSDNLLWHCKGANGQAQGTAHTSNTHRRGAPCGYPELRGRHKALPLR
jgi:hypothetical protein